MHRVFFFLNTLRLDFKQKGFTPAECLVKYESFNGASAKQSCAKPYFQRASSLLSYGGG